jgi:hypothetical protein
MANKQDQEPEFALAELTPGEVALCLREGENLHIIREHMTPQDGVQMKPRQDLGALHHF